MENFGTSAVAELPNLCEWTQQRAQCRGCPRAKVFHLQALLSSKCGIVQLAMAFTLTSASLHAMVVWREQGSWARTCVRMCF